MKKPLSEQMQKLMDRRKRAVGKGFETRARTNADHIRAMSDEELSELLCTADWCGICDQLKEDGTCKAMEMDGPLAKHCVKAGLRWLQQPYKEEE